MNEKIVWVTMPDEAGDDPIDIRCVVDEELPHDPSTYAMGPAVILLELIDENAKGSARYGREFYVDVDDCVSIRGGSGGWNWIPGAYCGYFEDDRY